MQAFGTDRPDDLGQADILLKLLRRSGPLLAPGKTRASASGPKARPKTRAATLRQMITAKRSGSACPSYYA